METDNRGQENNRKKTKEKKFVYLKQTRNTKQTNKQKFWSAILIKNKREKTQMTKLKNESCCNF